MDIPESPEAPAHVVEHAVQHHPDASFVKGLADLLKVLVGAQAAVDLPVVPGVVAMGVGLKHRGKVHRPNAQLFQVGDPLLHLLDAMGLHPVVVEGRAAKPQGVNLVKHSALGPISLYTQHRTSSFAPVPFQTGTRNYAQQISTWSRPVTVSTVL